MSSSLDILIIETLILFNTRHSKLYEQSSVHSVIFLDLQTLENSRCQGVLELRPVIPNIVRDLLPVVWGVYSALQIQCIDGLRQSTRVLCWSPS